MKKYFINWQSKLVRTVDMILDKSEVFDDYPCYRYRIIHKIWQES
jgi:hypothetical protein